MKFQCEAARIPLLTLLCLALSCTSGTGGDDGGTGGGGGGNGAASGAGTGQAGASGGDAGKSATQGGQAGDSSGAGGDGGVAGQSASAGAGGQVPGAGAGGTADDGLEPCATHPYCNDFENTPVGGVPKGSNSISQGNTLAVTENKAYAGKRSLFVEAVGGAGTQARFGIVVGNRFKNPKFIGYARMMVWLDSRAETGNGRGYWNMIKMSGLQTTKAVRGAGVAFGGPDGNKSSWVIYQGGGPPVADHSDCMKTVSPPVIPLKQWVCVEMKVDETSPVPYGISINGKPLPDFSLMATNTGSNCAYGPDDWYVMDVQSLTFGWSHSHEQTGAGRMWIDDIVVDEKPIGCPPQ